jgi:HSP20 family protein
VPGNSAGGGTDEITTRQLRKDREMNALTCWDPFKEMDDLQSRLAKLFGVAPSRTATGGQELMTVAEWAPSVDISEDAKAWLVKAELPEVKKEDMKVRPAPTGVTCSRGKSKMFERRKPWPWPCSVPNEKVAGRLRRRAQRSGHAGFLGWHW